MIIELGTIATGKTSRALTWLAEHQDGILIVCNKDTKQEAIYKLKQLGLSHLSKAVMTLKEYLNMPKKKKHEVFIDEALLILERLLKCELAGVNARVTVRAEPCSNLYNPDNFDDIGLCSYAWEEAKVIPIKR